MLRSVETKPIYPQQDLADRLRVALEESGVTQAELARACAVTDQAVYKWLTTGRIGKQHFPTICAVTGKSFEYFFVDLKTWRRVAAIALLLTLPQAILLIDLACSPACVLCKIRRTALVLFHFLTRFGRFDKPLLPS